MSFDVHVHPWTRAFVKRNGAIMKACSFFRLEVSRLPATTAQLLEEMDEVGVARAVILGQDTHATRNPAFGHYTLKNDDLSRIAARSKDRLVPFAGVDPNAGKDTVLELRRAVRDLGCAA